MRIVVTGAGGFVGQALIRALGGAHDIVALDTALRGGGGDITDPAVLAVTFADGCDAVVHLATVPGGAAEGDPALAKRVNVDATMALVEAAAAAGDSPRFVFASSIAVFGEPLPSAIDDATPLAPRLVYGAQKAMMEQWLATQTRRGAIDGVSLRLPGIVARPQAASGMKSAFMSDVFHALRADAQFTAPVSPGATMWLMSVGRVAANLVHALANGPHAPMTLPALRVRFADLVAEIARQTGRSTDLVSYHPDPALEAAFGHQPPLATPAADAAGFAHDGSLPALVASALASLG